MNSNRMRCCGLRCPQTQRAMIYHGQPERDRQILKALWQRHQMAKDLDKSGKYLSRITEVARKVNRGEPLSERAKMAIQQDLQMAQEQQGQAGGNPKEVSLGKLQGWVMEAGR